MVRWHNRLARVGFSLVAVAMLASCQSGGVERQIDSLTIYPIAAAGAERREFGEALGLVLEKSGFRHLKMSEGTFRSEDGAALDEVAASFGSFVAQSSIDTRFALYCEFQGTPKDGVQGIRGVVVGKDGRVVWKEAQTPEDREFKRRRPGNPMECCVFLSERLRPMLVMASAKEQREEGAMARLWAEKSGSPGKGELEAIRARQTKLKEIGREATLVVYPIRVGGKVDRNGAADLVSLLNGQKLCKATVASDEVWFEVAPSSNEQRVLWDMAKSFRQHARKGTGPADFVLYGDYGISPSGDQVGYVHLVLCNRDGDFVVVDFQNSHHGDFRSIAPKSIKDCNRLAATRLAEYLQ